MIDRLLPCTARRPARVVPALAGTTAAAPAGSRLVGGALAGVLGGHEGGGTVPEISYSAVMGDRARALYRRAADTTVTTAAIRQGLAGDPPEGA
ncbi:hypothetical protein [Streptomyces sp. NPDC051211]|uniref:hypothetical protein n=1 Tax=Streptomyces sp. NPDC051211 TaxID=3154643 RepID=UPI00344E6318